MERIAMSQEELDDLHWLKRVEAGSMTQREAAEKIRTDLVFSGTND